jgi:hypothetical protein
LSLAASEVTNRNSINRLVASSAKASSVHGGPAVLEPGVLRAVDLHQFA